MERCPRCSTMVEAGWGYCPVCGRPRILESLRTPVAQPDWHHRAFQGIVLLACLWLAVTVAVAFLREYKAVRDGERLLAESQPKEAWAALQPFIPAHTDHAKAHLLCGKATIRLHLWNDARYCLDKHGELAPETKGELEADYAQVLTEKARALPCNRVAVGSLVAGAETLGESFVDNVAAGFDSVVETCLASKNGWELAGVTQELVERGHGLDLVTRGYAPAIRKALLEGRKSDARGLVYWAKEMVPESKEAVESAMNEGAASSE